MLRRHRFSVLMSFVILTVVGLALIPKLSVQLNPSHGSGSITVNYTWGGAPPEVLERQVTARLEGLLSTVQGVTKIRSVSNYGNGYITLSLDKNTDFDQLRFEVSGLIRQVYPQLPPSLSYPGISLNSPEQDEAQKPLMTLQLNGNAPASVLRKVAEEQLKPALAQIEGLYNVEVYGGNGQEWVLEYDQVLLISLNITENEIVSTLQSQLERRQLGFTTKADNSRIGVSIASSLDLTTNRASQQEIIELINQIPVKKVNERIIHLGDLVKISRQEQPTASYYRINGKNALNVVLVANVGVNQLALAKEVRTFLQRFSTTLPPTYQVQVEYDSTEFIQENLQKIWIQSGLAILILLLFVGITSRSWRYTGLIFISLVVNLALSFILFYTFSVEIHLYSLAALTTSLGIIIDNVIVMIDHYRRYRSLTVFTALLGATLTTCAGLSVIWFLPEASQIDLFDFALVMVITLSVSLIVALFFVPSVMEFRFIEPSANSFTSQKRKWTKKRTAWLSMAYAGLLRLLLRFRKTAYFVGLLAFGSPVFLLPNRLENDHPLAAYYNPIAGNEWYQENVKPLIDKYLGGSLRLFVNYVYEGSYSTKPERTALYVNAGLPNQSTLQQMNEIMTRIESELGRYQEIDRYVTNVYNGQLGGIVVYFKPEFEQSTFPFMLKNRAISLSTEMSGINWDIYGVGQGFSQNLDENATPTFNVAMYGYNYAQLEQQATLLKQSLEAHPRIQEVSINKSPRFFRQKDLFEFKMNINEQALVQQNSNNTMLFEWLNHQDNNSQADYFTFINGDYQGFKVIPTQSKHFNVWKLNHTPVLSSLADKTVHTPIKFDNIGSITKQKVSPEIVKEDQQYVRLVSFDYYGSPAFGEKFLDKTLNDLKPLLPLGYSTKKINYLWYSQETKTQYELLGLVIILIYMICAIIFESFLQPFALILLIPLSFIGVFLTFYCFDYNFDQGGYASFVLLSGNVVCAAIFIIAEFNQLKKIHAKTSAFRLYLKAYQHKIVPILLTVLSTVVGLVPFLIYGETEAFWFSLGVGTIGGLLMSLLAIWVYLPLFLIPHLTKKPRLN